MELRDYLRIARRWLWLAALSVAAFGIGAFLVSTQLTRVYRAEAIVLVNQTQSPSTITYQDVLGSQQLANTYARLAVTDTNLERALALAGFPAVTLDELREDASASVGRDTQLITISVLNPEAELAATLANAIALSLPTYIREAQLAGGESADVALNSVFVAQQARVPDDAVSPNVFLVVALGLLIGAVVAVVAIAVLEYTTDGIEGADDVESAGATLLGSVWQVPAPAGVDKEQWRPSIEADNGLRESLGRVQANMAFALGASGAKVVLVTSPHSGDGKTTIAVNLAQSLANSARRVLLVDGDLRKPSIHQQLSLHNVAGLSSAFLLGPEGQAGLIRSISDSLDVLTSGPTPPNPVELLSSEKLPKVMETIRTGYDLVVVDAPPALGIADASLWAANVDAVLLVVRRRKTSRGQLVEALKTLRGSEKPLLGVVLNAAKPTRSEGYYGYTAYGYGQRAETRRLARAASPSHERHGDGPSGDVE